MLRTNVYGLKNILKIILAAIILIIIFGFKDDCGGKQRWSVKILTDKESSKINWTPKHTIIKYLTQLEQPFPIDDKKFNKNIRFGYEFNVYEIICTVKEYIKEDDGDYHLVLVDISDTTMTMVGEIPNPQCDSTKKSNFINAFTIVRNDFEKYASDKEKLKSMRFLITGVCFFDKIHGQKGAAKNGVELHPIMDIIKF